MIQIAIFLSFLPFIIFIFLLLWKKLSLTKTSIITFFVTLFLLIFYWKIYPISILNSLTKGLLVAIDIYLIIFGALFFLEVTKDLKIINNLSHFLKIYFKDLRVQVIFLAWFFSNFIEGTAGFGTPAAIVVPILISLGISPLSAVIISLLGNSTSGIFGAAGTPIRTGFAGLDTTNIAQYGSLLNFVGILVPIFMIFVLSKEQKQIPKNEQKNFFFNMIPFAIWSGIAFVLPVFLIAPFGQEFATIFGSIIGLLIVLITTKFGFLIPKKNYHFTQIENLKERLPTYKIIFPYLTLVFLLIIGKFFLGTININFAWGFKYVFNLFNPGFAFFISGIIISFLWGKNELTKTKILFAIKKAYEPFLVIISMSCIAQLMINSNNNFSQIPSMLNLISKIFETHYLVFFSPFIGAFGAFITGSITVSNIMFGNLLSEASKNLNLNTAIVLSATLVGAAAGNMIALADVLVASTVAGIENKTREVLKGVIYQCLLYIFLVGLLAFILSKLV